MNNTLSRIAAIIQADFFIRFRRMSTVVTLLGLCLLAYLIVPDPSSGRALMVIAGRRTLLNSEAISLATASMCSTLLCLIGFYLVSNSLRRDIQARTGFIIAATPMSNIEYIAGKFFGNIVYLSAITIGFMLGTMVMHLIRGEETLRPLVYCTSFFAITPPGIVFVSAVALLFESVRFISGKFGDVLYFFVWTFLIGTSAMVGERGLSISASAMLDIPGISIVIAEVTAIAGTTQASVGSSSFDQSLPPYLFAGYPLGIGWFVLRCTSFLAALPFLGIALLFFHRFDPEKTKAVDRSSSGNMVMALNRKLKPLVRWIGTIGPGVISSPFPRAVWLDTMLTFTLYPLVLLAIVPALVLSLVMPADVLMRIIVPVMFLVLVVVLADTPTRDYNAGISSLIYTAPLIREHFVWWKFCVALTLTLMFTLVPMIRIVSSSPGIALSLFIGSLVAAAAATSLGVLTRSPKTFAVCFLLFLYLVLNGEHEPSLDFAGWYGIATAGVRTTYAAIVAGLLAIAHMKHMRAVRQ